MSGTNLKAITVVSRLLESDLSFHNILEQGSSLEFYGRSRLHPDAEASGQLEIWWTVEIDARQWGVKAIEVTVTKLVLDGWWMADTDVADKTDTGETFHYEYPSATDPAAKSIGKDVDAPTPANVLRMAQPNWKVSWKIGAKAENRLALNPEATVDFHDYTIAIEF